jgi:hypothetical protein
MSAAVIRCGEFVTSKLAQAPSRAVQVLTQGGVPYVSTPQCTDGTGTPAAPHSRWPLQHSTAR